MSAKNRKNFQTAKARMSFEEGSRAQREHQAVEESLADDLAVEEELEMEDFENDCNMLSALEDGEDPTPFIPDFTAKDSVVCSSSDLRSAEEELKELDEPGDPEFGRFAEEEDPLDYDPLEEFGLDDDDFNYDLADMDPYDCEDGLDMLTAIG